MLDSRIIALLILDMNDLFDIEYQQQHAEKKAASISQLATLYCFNVLQVQLVRVLLEQVLPHAQENLASRHLPDRVIWLHMHVFHRILEQGC